MCSRRNACSAMVQPERAGLLLHFAGELLLARGHPSGLAEPLARRAAHAPRGSTPRSAVLRTCRAFTPADFGSSLFPFGEAKETVPLAVSAFPPRCQRPLAPRPSPGAAPPKGDNPEGNGRGRRCGGNGGAPCTSHRGVPATGAARPGARPGERQARARGRSVASPDHLSPQPGSGRPTRHLGAQECVPQESEDSRTSRLSFCMKVCYGIGGVPNQIASSATAFYLQLFLLDIAQIPAAQVSLVLFGGKVSGAAADPVAGFFINRSQRTGSGRLMPWVLGCTPFITLAYFFLWFLPPFTSLRGLWYTTFYCLFQGLATFFQVPYTALTMLLTPCPRERDSATAYRMTVEMAGTLVGATVHGLIVSGAHKHHRCEATVTPGPVTISPNAARLYYIAAAVVAVTYPVCSSLLCLGVKERPDPSTLASGPGLSFLAGLGLTTRHPPYLKMVISFLFISAAVQVEQSYLVLFCTHASQLHDHVQGLVLTVLVSAVLSTPLWEWVLQRFGKKTSAFGISAMVPFAILLAAVPTAPVAYVVAFVSGVSIAVSLLLPWSMLPDVVDDFQLQHHHGPGLETIFYSSYVFFTKLSGACALGISTLSLEFSGYKAGACKQAEEVVVTLKVLIGAVPTCMILAGLCILMVGSTPKTPSQDASSRLSLRRRTSYSLA
ncbi:major facilitator superfamily domain-containing protein 2B isoform X1 [Trachypithecus francoisi]|uniref:major facilitator superfamily domain-containing protein 2B isoform X1 n=1 Tax=Trachypithecus francoisi TaxID=54180 RepID=UPI00141AEB3A|nr:major facilitator superfamily domain-containing protein 2B isoform X1 [Trachypithecus francoisi]